MFKVVNEQAFKIFFYIKTSLRRGKEVDTEALSLGRISRPECWLYNSQYEWLPSAKQSGIKC